jgi:hypothetical protein
MPSKRALLSALLLALTWAMLLPSPSRHKRHASKARRDRLNSGPLKSSSFATTVNATYESALQARLLQVELLLLCHIIACD